MVIPVAPCFFNSAFSPRYIAADDSSVSRETPLVRIAYLSGVSGGVGCNGTRQQSNYSIVLHGISADAATSDYHLRIGIANCFLGPQCRDTRRAAILYRNAPLLPLLRSISRPPRPRRARPGPVSRAPRRAIREASQRRARAVWPHRERRGEHPYRLFPGVQFLLPHRLAGPRRHSVSHASTG